MQLDVYQRINMVQCATVRGTSSICLCNKVKFTCTTVRYSQKYTNGEITHTICRYVKSPGISRSEKENPLKGLFLRARCMAIH